MLFRSLIEAFAKLGADNPARLVIVGDGIVRPQLQSLAQKLGVADRTEFRGFTEPADVPLWYAVADVMVLPSVGETWSVAVLEALASGLPVVTTDTVGAAVDAIKDPAVGTVVPTGNVSGLTAAIAARLADGTGRDRVPSAWGGTREQFRYEVLSRRVVDAIRNTIGRPELPNAG